MTSCYSGRRADWLDLRIPPVAVALGIAALGWLAADATGQFTFDFAGRMVTTVALAFGGAAISLLGVAEFRRARTTVNPMTPQSSTALVVGGIYRVTRNPMYLGFLFLLAAWATWLAHPFAVAMLPGFVAYMNRFQIRPEEMALHERFGPEFAAYHSSVRRWL